MSDQTKVVQTSEVLPQVEATPLSMLNRAVSSGATIDVLERLMALNERWQADQARRAFTAALSALRDEMPRVVKSRTVDFTTARGRTHYQYEDLALVVDALSPVMAKHGLSFRWRTDSTQKGLVSVTCILEHSAGHSEETTLAAPFDDSGNKNPIQAIGSAVTYLQRYTLKAALGVAAAQDDDGQSAGEAIAPAQRESRHGVSFGGRKKQASQQAAEISEAQARRIIAIAREVGEQHGEHGFHVVASVLRSSDMPPFPPKAKREDALIHLCDNVTPDLYEEFVEQIQAWEPEKEGSHA